MRLTLAALAIALFAVTPTAQQHPSPGALTPQIDAILKSIKAADKGQLAVSEEDGRFMRVLIGVTQREVDPRDRRRQRLQRDLARPRRTRVARPCRLDRVRPAAREGSGGQHPEGRAHRRRACRARATRSWRFRSCKARSTSCFSSVEARLQALLRYGLSTPGCWRRLPRAQRDQQVVRDEAVPRHHPEPPGTLHVNRVTRFRGNVGVRTNSTVQVHEARPSSSACRLDLGAGRRGVDMGPSAFRIAGIRDQIAALGRVVDRQGRPACPDSRDAASGRQAEEIHPATSRRCARSSTTVR